MTLLPVVLLPMLSASLRSQVTHEPVTIQLKWKHQFQFAGYYAAQLKGFYAEEGLTVKLAAREGSEDHVQAVLDGKAEYGTAECALVVNRIQGAPVVLLAQVFQHSPLVGISRKGSGITTPKDMIGKQVERDFRGKEDAPLVAMLVEALGGLDDVDLVQHSYSSDSLINGTVDVTSSYLTDEPFLLRQRGIEVNVIAPRNYGIDFYGDNLFTTEQEIREHPGRADRVRRATIKGWEYALRHPEEIIDVILDRYATQLTREQLQFEARMTAMMIIPDLVPVGTVNPARYRRAAETYARLGMVATADVPPAFFHRAAPTLTLTPAERAWLEAHPVIRITGDPDWLPQEAFTEDGTYVGIVADVLDLLEPRLGARFERVPAETWSEAVRLLETGAVDMLSETTTSERQTMTFTDSYIVFPVVIMGRDGATRVSGPSELAGQRVAVVRDYGYVIPFRRQYPNLDYVVVDTVREGLLSLAAGDADTLIATASTASYLMSELGLTDLQIIGATGLSIDLGFGVRTDAPLLVSILNKAIASVTETERLAIRERWVPVAAEALAAPASHRGSFAKVAGMVAGIMGAVTLAMWLLIRLAGDRLPVALQTTGSQMVWILVASLFLTVIITVAWLGLEELERQARRDAGQMLSLVAQTTQVAVHTWLAEEKLHAEMLATNPDVAASVGKLVRLPHDVGHITGSTAFESLHRHVTTKGEQHRHLALSVVAPDFTCVYSTRESSIGRRCPMADTHAALLRKAFSGQTVFIPPVHTDAPPAGPDTGEQRGLPVMAVAAPIRDPVGTVLAVLSLCHAPAKHLSQMARSGGARTTGETYMLDGAGFLLSQSRSAQVLADTGVLPHGTDGFLGLRLSDPGGNVLAGHRPSAPWTELPLTLMAAAAASGRSGVDVDGYRDSRGIRVLGAWVWDDELQVGFATEIDQTAALAGYRNNRAAVISVLAVVALLTSALAGSLILNGERANKALRQARDDWEQVAEERSAQLTQSESQFRTLFEASQDAVIILEGPLLVECNHAALEMFGYSAKQAFLNVPTASHVPKRQPNGELSADVAAAHIAVMATGELRPFEWVWLRANGTPFHSEVQLSPAEYRGGPAIQAVIRDISDRKLAEEQLKDSLRDKEVLLREIHHRVKNNLATIMSMLNLQSSKIDDARIREALRDSRTRVRSMALIHETLYRSADLSRISLRPYVKDLAEGVLLAMSGNVSDIRMLYDIENIGLHIDQAVPCGLIVNELLTNSIKHAFPHGKGEIRVAANYIGHDRVQLVVSDDGGGFPTAQDLQNPDSLGLRLVSILAHDQLEGDLDIDSCDGARVTVRWPTTPTKGKSINRVPS